LLSFLKSFERRTIKPTLQRLKRWRHTTYGDIRVNYRDHLDRGAHVRHGIPAAISRSRHAASTARIRMVCGARFHRLRFARIRFLRHLCLADINPEAVEACRLTVAQNGLTNRVSIYHSDNLDGISSSERWDLVVGNPPHFSDISPGELRFHDEGWKLHQRFFAAIDRFLKPGGIIVLLENNDGSTAETFRSMIEAAGLCIGFIHNCESRRTPYTRVYYLGIARQGDMIATWAVAAGK
jgi:SAM-dependent methyltransferase